MPTTTVWTKLAFGEIIRTMVRGFKENVFIFVRINKVFKLYEAAKMSLAQMFIPSLSVLLYLKKLYEAKRIIYLTANQRAILHIKPK